MKKIYLILCLLIGTLMITPMNISAAQCYYCPHDAAYKWTDDGSNCTLQSSITTQEDCNKENIATEDDFTGDLTCGGTSFKFPKSLPNFTNTIFDLLKVLTPVIVIITGMLDLLKAVSAQKEDEIKKAQQKLVRRLIAGAVVFLVFQIIETVIYIVAENNEATNAWDCVECFLIDSNDCG